MVINKDGLITENPIDENVNKINMQNNIENNISDTSTILEGNSDSFIKDTISDLPSDSPISEIQFENPSSDSASITDTPKSTEEKTAETNCLALTVRKNYNLSIVKNSIFTTLRVSWKVALSTFVLNVLKLFF